MSAPRTNRRSRAPARFASACAAAWLVACAPAAPARPLTIGTASERAPLDAALARWHWSPTRGGARAAFERGETDLFVGTLCEFLRSARHGGRTPRVLAARRAAAPLRILAAPSIERVVELKGRGVGLDPDQDGLLLVVRALRAERLELDDVRVEWRDADAFDAALAAGELAAVVTTRERAAPQTVLGASDGWHVLVGSTELALERAADVDRALALLAPRVLDARASDELRAALDELEQALVAAGELIGPTGGADALRAADARVRQLDV